MGQERPGGRLGRADSRPEDRTRATRGGRAGTGGSGFAGLSSLNAGHRAVLRLQEERAAREVRRRGAPASGLSPCDPGLGAPRSTSAMPTFCRLRELPTSPKGASASTPRGSSSHSASWPWPVRNSFYREQRGHLASSARRVAQPQDAGSSMLIPIGLGISLWMRYRRAEAAYTKRPVRLSETRRLSGRSRGSLVLLSLCTCT
jgi:hypothetical protein